MISALTCFCFWMCWCTSGLKPLLETTLVPVWWRRYTATFWGNSEYCCQQWLLFRLLINLLIVFFVNRLILSLGNIKRSHSEVTPHPNIYEVIKAERLECLLKKSTINQSTYLQIDFQSTNRCCTATGRGIANFNRMTCSRRCERLLKRAAVSTVFVLRSASCLKLLPPCVCASWSEPPAQSCT